MRVELTEEQSAQLDFEDGKKPRIFDLRTDTQYVLIPEAEYDQIQELMEDERKRAAMVWMGQRNAARRMVEAP